MQHIKKNWADCRELRYILKETQEIKYGVSTRDGHVVADRCGSSGWCGWKSYAHYPHPEGKKRMVPWSIILLQILFQRCVLLWYHYIYMAIFSSAIEEKTVWPFWVELWVILLLLDAVHVRAQMICICRYMRMMRIGKYRHMAIPSYQVSGWHKLLEPENLVLRIFLPSIFEMFWGLKGWQWGLLVHSFHSPQSSILTPESWILNPQSWILSPQS